MSPHAGLAALAVGMAAALAVGRLAGVELRFAVRLRRRRPGRDRATWLAQSGSQLGVGQYRATMAIAGVVTLVIVSAITGSVAVALVPAGAAASVPRAVLARRRTERLARLRNAWPDGLRDIVTAIASGASVHQAVERLAQHGPEPLRVGFARYPATSRMLGTVAALEVIREELADPTTDRVVEVLVLAHERGGAIVRTVLDDLARATTRDVRLAEEIHTEGLEMRINARSVVVLPWIVLVLLCARPGPFRDFYGTARGAAVLVVGAVMSTVGLIVVRRLGRVDDEPRVFGSTSGTTSA